MSILGVFGEVIHAEGGSEGGAIAAVVKEYIDAFTRVERFGTVVLFLSRAEKAVARGVWEALGTEKRDVGKVWSPVWP